MNVFLRRNVSHKLSLCIGCIILGIINLANESLAMQSEMSLRAIMEIEPSDRVNFDPDKIIIVCTAYLSEPEKLTKSEKCKLYLLRGYAYLFKHQFGDAIKDFDEIAVLRPKDDDFQVLFLRNSAHGNQAALGAQHGAIGNRRIIIMALADAEKLINMKPDSAKACLNMAMWRFVAGDIKGCIEYCDKSIDLSKNHPEPYFFRSLAHKRKSEYLAALEDLDNCIKLGGYAAGTSVAATPYILRAELFLGPCYNPGRALNDLNMAYRIDPNSIQVKFRIWEYYFNEGKYEMADYIQRKTRRENPKSFQSGMFTVAKIATLIQKRNYKEALNMADKFVEQQPRLFYGYYWRGAVHFAQGDFEASRRDYEEALALSENNNFIRGALAYLMATVPSARNTKEAVKLARICCEQSRYKNPKYLMLLAMSHASAGEKDDAVRFAKEALEKLTDESHLKIDYEKRLKLFMQGKTYIFSPESRSVDYLFF